MAHVMPGIRKPTLCLLLISLLICTNLLLIFCVSVSSWMDKQQKTRILPITEVYAWPLEHIRLTNHALLALRVEKSLDFLDWNNLPTNRYSFCLMQIFIVAQKHLNALQINCLAIRIRLAVFEFLARYQIRKTLSVNLNVHRKLPWID